MRHTLVSRSVRAAVFVLAFATLHAQAPTFKSGVDMIRIDVTAVDDAGNPVADLGPGDFEVKVNGQTRPVQSLQFIDLPSPAKPAILPDYSSNDAADRSRLLVVAVDEDSLDPGVIRPLVKTLDAQFRRLPPADRVSLVALPPPGVNVDFTGDPDVLWAGLSRLHGWPYAAAALPGRVASSSMVQSAPARGRGLGMDERNEGFERARSETIAGGGPTFTGNDRAQRVVTALHELARDLGRVDGPKTLIIISARLPYAHGLLHHYKRFAQYAAEARLNVYVLKAQVNSGAASDNSELIELTGSGMAGTDALAGLTGGAVFQAIGGAAGVIDRVVRETTGSYVLGVAPPDGAPLARAARLEVHVRRPGVTVRGRTVVVPPATRASATDPRVAIEQALRQPRGAAEFPMRVGASNRRGANGSLTTLLTTDLDLGTEPGAVAVGYEIVDGQRIVADFFQPALPGEATRDGVTTSFALGVSVPAGAYRLRLSASDATGRRASVEHPLVVGLRQAGTLSLSDVLVGGTATGRLAVRNMVSAVTRFGAALEIYGAPDQLTGLEVEFALTGADGATRAVRRQAAAETPDPTRRVAQVSLPLEGLSAGRYRMVATVMRAGMPRGRATRTVEVVADTR